MKNSLDKYILKIVSFILIILYKIWQSFSLQTFPSNSYILNIIHNHNILNKYSVRILYQYSLGGQRV
ncbi:MAG: hypothetical protein KatS3mg027_0483 [Bacteroidia bacterium]|nr:MAG: hypothetical protein KatS3mg027_0483 [Bacteroidia bacterium]